MLVSRMINALIFRGSKYETLSARCYRLGVIERDPVWRRRMERIDRLFRSKNHCFDSYVYNIMYSRMTEEPVIRVEDNVQ